MEALLKVVLLEHTQNPDKVVATAAKLCYSSSSIEDIQKKISPEQAAIFVSRLRDMGHESPLEHVSFTFGIEGVSRALTHQLVRHRIASYSQQSQRYVKEGQFDYIIPAPIKQHPELTQEYRRTMIVAQENYNSIFEKLLDKFKAEGVDTKSAEKKASENARYVLPNACETKIIVTMNARSLLHFFGERCCLRAQDEIRLMARIMLKEVRKISPVLFSNAGAKCLHLEYCPEGEMSCGNYPTLSKIINKNECT